MGSTLLHFCSFKLDTPCFIQVDVHADERILGFPSSHTFVLVCINNDKFRDDGASKNTVLVPGKGLRTDGHAAPP